MKRLVEILNRMKEIEGIVNRGEATPEIEKEVKDLLAEKRDIEKKELEMRAAFEEGQRVVIPSQRSNQTVLSPTDTPEYRQAFRDYVMGNDRRVLDLPESRADATTTTSDIGALIPTTVLNQVIELMKDYGEIYNLITITNYAGGVDIPVASAKPTASWIAEGSTAEKQKKAVTKISFGYFKLQIKVATTLLAATVSLSLFESTVAANIAEAMVYAIEEAILTGDGNGKPKGITEDARITNRPVFLPADATWQGWNTKFINKILTAYRKRKNGVIIVNPLTWDKYMNGLVDDNGQPIGRTNYGINGQETLTFLGKKVILRDEIASLDTALLNEPVLIYGDLKDYLLNTNLQITTRRYFDEDTDEYVQKSTLICDGKVADANGFVVLQSAAA